MVADDLRDRTCLVTGATGFLGSWVVERLVTDGARVRCLVRSTSRREFLPSSDLECAIGDIMDVRSVRRAMEGVDYVFHVAGLIKAPNEAAFLQVNGEGTRNVMTAAAERADRVRRVLVVSSLSAAGPSRPGAATDESWTPRPMSPYGRSKLRGEEIAREMGQNVPMTIVRPPAIYGPRDRETLMLFQMARLPIHPVIARHGAISTIHAADLADGILVAATHPRSVGQTYYLSGDESPSASELFRLIATALGRRAVRVPVPASAIVVAGQVAELVRDTTGLPLIFDRGKAEEMANGHWACSGDRARRELGFEPRIKLADGIAATAKWYQAHGWL
jgi:nucleoside-diphosphate-sugar epimerase